MCIRDSYDDAGNLLNASVVLITRATGQVTLAKNLVVNGTGSFGGAVTMAGLTATGGATFTSAVTVSGPLVVTAVATHTAALTLTAGGSFTGGVSVSYTHLRAHE